MISSPLIHDRIARAILSECQDLFGLCTIRAVRLGCSLSVIDIDLHEGYQDLADAFVDDMCRSYGESQRDFVVASRTAGQWEDGDL